MDNTNIVNNILAAKYDIVIPSDIEEIFNSSNVTEEIKILFLNKYLSDHNNDYKYIKSKLDNITSFNHKQLILKSILDEYYNKIVPDELKKSYINRFFNSTLPALKVITMQKDEAILLTHWVLYYAQILGFENIVILDNSSEDLQTKRILKFFSECGIKIIYNYCHPDCHKMKGGILSAEARQHRPEIKLMSLLDIDEFYYINDGGNISFNPKKIYNELLKLNSIITEDNPIMRVGQCYYNIPESWEINKGFLKKVILHSSYGEYIDGGQHLWDGEKDHPWGLKPYTFPVSNIGILHFHFRPFEHMVKMSKEKLQAKGVNVNDIEFIKKYRGHGSHVKKYLYISREQYYKDLESIPQNIKINIQESWKECNLPYPFI